MANPSLLTTAETVAGFLGIDVLNPTASDWMILDNNSNQVIITPDTVPSFEYKAEVRVSDFPVQQGAFASYNSVQMPFTIRMKLVCSGLNFFQQASSALGLNFGTQYMQKSDFLTTLEYMRTTTDLFQIVTPDETYANCKLEHYDYRREARQGATMLVVDAWFREVRQVTTSNSSVDGLPFVNSDSASAANPLNNGIVQTFPYGSNPASIGFFQ